MKKKQLRLLALCCVLALSFGLLTACGNPGVEASTPGNPSNNPGVVATPAPVDPGTTYKETVVIAYTSEIANGAPYFRVSTQDRFMTVMTHDTLCLFDWQSGDVLPNIAKEWTDVNGDGLVWEVVLNEGVQFHDGEGNAYGELTAADVKFTFEYAGAGGTGEVGYPLNVYTQMDAIDIVSDYVVRFTLNTALYDFPSYLTGDAKILCAKAFEEMNDPIKAQEVGAGPYYLDYSKSMSGSHWTVTRFESYWKGTENYATKHIECRLVPDANTTANALKTGQIDLGLSISSSTIADIEAAGRVVHAIPGSSNTFFAFNYHNVFDEVEDLALRQAIAYAIDKQAVMAVWYAGLPSGTESNNFAVSAIPGYTQMDNVYPYNVEKAKSIMEGLGYNENNRLTLRCAHYEAYRKIAEAVQALLSEIYIDIEPVLIDGSNFASFLRGQEGWDVALNYASMGGAMFYDFNRFLNSKGSTTALYGWNSAEYDAMQEKAMNSGSYDAMKAEFAAIQKWVMEQVAYLPLAVGNMNVGTVAELEGLNMNPNLQLINLSTIRVPE